MMKAAKDRLNAYALAFEDAQTDIREIIKRAHLNAEKKAQTREKVLAVINKATNGVEIERLKTDAQKSLWAFAERQRRIWADLDLTPELLAFLGVFSAQDAPSDKAVESRATRAYAQISRSFETQAKGVPLNEYYKEVWQNRVKPTIDRLIHDTALDPNDFTGRNSLRNLAEMEVRYKGHLDSIEEMKDAGVKLVVCSSHSDCSDRCAPWQGRVYSLDGTTGRIDGHKYVPIETATDVYYTTKAGRVYKNGLLGFNCRHHLAPYKGQLLPNVSAATRKAEYDITLTQRRLERNVREKRVEALMYKDIDKRSYLAARRKATALYKVYVDYCEKNNRAYYPMRLAI